MLKKVKPKIYMGIISIIGFLTILISSIFEIDIGILADSLLFIIIGIMLVIAGGIKLFFQYFKDGLTKIEITKIVTVVVGLSSIIVGILIAPFFNIQYPILDAVKAFIAIIAILMILVEVISK